MKEKLKNKVFDVISEVLHEEGLKGYVVGGFVRDLLLKRECKDIDVVVLGSGIEVAEKTASKLKGASKVSVFKNFGTAMFKYKDMEVEFVGARKESYRKNSRKPVVENGTLEDDQNRRDFTINALAISLNSEDYGNLSDPFNGLDDLENKIIRTPLDSNKTFSDDPLRMLRAIRFATQLDFTIAPDTFTGIKENAERINIISQERIVDELTKIMVSKRPHKGFNLLSDTSLLALILPEVEELKGVEEKEGKAHKDNFHHSVKVLKNISRVSDNEWLRWAALLHDVAKPRTKKFIEGQGWTFHGHEFIGSKMIPAIFRRIKLPLDDRMKYVQKIVALHLRPIVLAQDEVTDSAVRRLLFDAGDDIDDLMLLCEADITSKNEEKVKRYLENFQIVRKKLVEIEEKDTIRNFQPPISGDEIIKIFNIQPSRIVGEIKNAIKDAILDGVIGNNYDEAYSFMIRKAKELGVTDSK
ncbi:MAG: HD domain-containing protein [Bacteroidales bacterium]|nr:HD domain-containing protein [Bacteroidales bacterium]